MAPRTNTILEETALTPSQIVEALDGLIPTMLSVFIWGPPGIAKSAVVRQVAKKNKMGFVDARLSQMDPTDLRGIPIHVVENGVHGVRWSAPLILPRNLDFNQLTPIAAEQHIIRFENPHDAPTDINVKYVRTPGDPEGLRAEWRPIFDENDTSEDRKPLNDRFIVQIVDADGVLQPGTVRWTVTGNVRAILALEEFNSALPSVQAAAYQLVLDRKLGEYDVPDGVFICAMGNRETDKGVTYRMPTPIANRFVHLNMREFFDDWQTWAAGADVHPQVIGYLSSFKGDMFQFEPSTASRGFPTPRSWEFVSKVVRNNPKMNEQLMTAIIGGCIGDATAVKFMSFRKLANDMPDNNAILSGTITSMPNDQRAEIGLAFALTTSLCYELRDRDQRIKRAGDDARERQEWYEQASRFIQFMMKNFNSDVCIMGARQSIVTHKLPFSPRKMPVFLEFSNKYRRYILTE